MEPVKKRGRVAKPTESKTEIKKPATKQISSAFIALQVKAENVLEKYIDSLSSKVMESAMNQPAIASLDVMKDAVMSLFAMGLIDQYRIDLPEPEDEEELPFSTD